MVYAISVFVIVFLLLGSSLALVFYREVLGRRLASILEPREAANDRALITKAATSFGNLAGSIQKVVPKSQSETSRMRRRLIRAGFRGDNAVNIFYAFKALVPAGFCVAATATGLQAWSPLLVYGACLLAGYIIPDFVLDHMIKNRADLIRIGLPDALDLLVVCLEAGLSLDNAVLRVVDEMRSTHRAISDEFGLVMLEVRAGRPRMDAWRSLGERVDIEVMRLLVSILLQSDQYGTGISKTLRIQSDSMRVRRKQRVEELAAKTAVKLVFPLLLFIFPSLWVVVLGPAIIMITETLKL